VIAVVKMDGAPCGEGVLVGMSVLRKFDSVMLKDGVLTLTGRAGATHAPTQPQPSVSWWSWK